MSNFAPETVSPATPEKYGEREIAEGKLITFPNPRIGRRYDINITLPPLPSDVRAAPNTSAPLSI
jgi:7-cyano-7-deazaguanine reductase